ncbi:MAG: sigma-70 family RNA polymerase sigma factor [Abditibacteriales bacterium]|nr:sigma-70 family RNA polymerase sigma factor [Abditibacteriales bacterium]
MENVQEQVGKHPIAQLIGFTNVVALNIIRDDARQQKRQPLQASLDEMREDANDGDGATLADSIADAETDVSEEALSSFGRTALRRAVHQALAQLSQQQRAIIRLDIANEWELTDNEIANILSTTVNTVRNQRSRAMERLRESLQALCDKSPDFGGLLSDFLSRWRDA